MFKFEITPSAFPWSPFGLDLAGEGLQKLPVQIFILKLMYNEPLDTLRRNIEIPVDPRDSSQGTWLFTEQEFLDYLESEGRAIVPDGDPKDRFLFMGRRSGKSTICRLASLYDLTALLVEPDIDYRGPVSISHFDVSRELVVFTLQGLCDLSKNSSFLKSKEDNTDRFSYRTNSSLRYASHGRDIRVNGWSCVSKNGICGMSNYTAYLNEASWYPSNGSGSIFELVQAIRPSIHTQGEMGITYATTYHAEGNSPAFDEIYASSIQQDDTLMLALHTWEVNPNVPEKFYQSQEAEGYLHEFMGNFPQVKRR